MLCGRSLEARHYVANVVIAGSNPAARSMLRVCVCGSRSFDNYGYMRDCLDEILPAGDVEIISGCAMGADLTAERYAVARAFPIRRYPANWSIGRQAGMIRNLEMLKACDVVVAFWDGQSSGTRQMIEEARKAEKLLEVFTFNPEVIDL